MKFLFLLLFGFISSALLAQDHYYMLAGTYTRGKSRGIYVYDFNSLDGSASLVDSAVVSNPSYLAVSPGNEFVYAVNEDGNKGKGGGVSSFSFDNNTGHLTLLNRQLTMGDDPCYVTVDARGNWVIVGNYSSGSLSLFPINKDGSLKTVKSTIAHKGHGTNKDRQASPHVHSTVLSSDNHYLFVPDLGIDKVMIYAFDDRKGLLTPAPQKFVKLADGSGPRHFDFHPSGKWAFLVQEMGGTVSVFNYSKGKLYPIQTISALPAGYKDQPTSADIHVAPDGRFLYVSNRDNSNTIAIFKIDQETGKLVLVGHQSTMGKTSRNFNFDPTGNYLLVANQSTDNVVVFKIDHQTGLLTDTGNRMTIGNPVCIKWAGIKK